MKILITGGCKNGKSTYAQQLVNRLHSAPGEKLYIATMRPCDEEDLDRIARHRQERAGEGYHTLEQPVQIADCLAGCGSGSTLLLDSTTALLGNEMFRPDGSVDAAAAPRVIRELRTLCAGVKHIVLVSDTIYSDAQRYDPLTEGYRRGLAEIDRALAQDCDVVCEVAYGCKIFHKGSAEALLATHGEGQMILVFGGAYQGKLDFVRRRFSVRDGDCWDCAAQPEEPDSFRVVNHLEQLALRLVERGESPLPYFRDSLPRWQDKILLVEDISSGVVPIDPTLRRWREELGRCTTLLAQNAHSVYRLYCGIPTQLK